MQLATRRFLLRDFASADLPALAAYHADPRLAAMYGPGEGAAGHAAQLLAQFQAWAAERPRRNFQLAVALQGGGPLIGCAGLRTHGAAPGQAELGLELAPAHWGRYGYAAEIVQALLDFGFGTLHLTRIVGSTVSANTRVARLAAAWGAQALAQPAPPWMAERGWHPVDWHLERGQWQAWPQGAAPRPRRPQVPG